MTADSPLAGGSGRAGGPAGDRATLWALADQPST
jgi:hypothetical protein